MHILHLVDASVGWEQRVALNQLLKQFSGQRFAQSIASVDGPARLKLALNGEHVELFARRGWLHHLCGARLRQWVKRHEIDLVHAWGLDAAETAGLALRSSTPLLVSQFDPRPTDLQVNMLRTVLPMTGGAVACASATVQRRLIEAGIQPRQCIVVRPGVDFQVINEIRRQSRDRGEAGGSTRIVVVTAHHDAPDAGQDIAVWAAAIARNLDTDISVMVPGAMRDDDRVFRPAQRLGRPDVVIRPQPGSQFELLVAAADILLLPVGVDISTTAIAWAMASSTLVVAGAVYATAELLSHKQNALLIKPAPPRRMAVRCAAVLSELTEIDELKDTARGQAYEVFGLRRCMDQHARLYDNLMDGRDPADGITDSAAVGQPTV